MRLSVVEMIQRKFSTPLRRYSVIFVRPANSSLRTPPPSVVVSRQGEILALASRRNAIPGDQGGRRTPWTHPRYRLFAECRATRTGRLFGSLYGRTHRINQRTWLRTRIPRNPEFRSESAVKNRNLI